MSTNPWLVYIAVCLTLIALVLIALGVAAVYFVWQLRRTARAVELLTLRAENGLGGLSGFLRGFSGWAGLVGSGLGRSSAAAVGLVYGVWRALRRRRREGKEEDVHE
jgi:hypothetical protein